MLKPRGRPKSPNAKIAIGLRLSPDTLFQTGPAGAAVCTPLMLKLTRKPPTMTAEMTSR